MKNNPFTSEIFTTLWLKHFYDSKPSYKFNFIKNVSFYKKTFLPVYINVGKNLTKGIFYRLQKEHSDFKGKIFLLYDIPDYFNVNEQVDLINKKLEVKKIYQYKGYMMDLTNFSSTKDYQTTQFKTKNKRYVRQSHIGRLEKTFEITYDFIFGEIDENKYNVIFDHFHYLLNIRFKGKNTDYHHLNKRKWQFYKELILPLIRAKQASFLIIYNEGIPIGINLNYHAENILFKAITVFDYDYKKFSIGKLSVLKLLDWCFENNYSFSDFSKGYFDYKEKWSNTQYNFNYHLLYDKSSFFATLMANTIETLFKFKLFLRKHNINEKYRKFIYNLKSIKNDDKNRDEFISKMLSKFEPSKDFEIIDVNEKKYHFLIKHINDFLFSNPQYRKNITVFKNSKTNIIVIKGHSKSIQLMFKNNSNQHL